MAAHAGLAGVASRDGAGLAWRPIEALVRRRPERSVAIVGGRHLGASGDAAVRLEVSIDGQPLDAWTATSGPFLRAIELEAGRLAGEGDARLTVSASREGAGTLPPITVEQFDLQSEGTAVWAFGEGWHEAEYDRRTRRSFRWSGPRAVLRIFNAVRDIEIALEGESPLRYFAEPPTVAIGAGDLVLRRERVGAAFSWRIRVPLEVLKRSAGMVSVTTDKTFRPSDRGLADGRKLGLRFFTITGSR